MGINNKIENINNNQFPKGVEFVVSATIENNDGKILLVKSPKWKNKWTVPGGHIEVGEKMADSVKREAQEEVGLKVEPIAIISSGELINSKDFHRPAHFIYFDFLCKSENIDDIKLDDEEITNYIWVTPEQGLKMDLGELYGDTIKKYIEYKKRNK